MKLIFTLIVIPLLALPSCVQTKRVSEPEKITLTFFDTYKTSGPTKALGAFLRTNKYISDPVADSVAAKLGRLTAGLGEFQGFEKITEKTYGENIMLLTYIVKYSRQPLRFNFKFYQPGNGW